MKYKGKSLATGMLALAIAGCSAAPVYKEADSYKGPDNSANIEMVKEGDIYKSRKLEELSEAQKAKTEEEQENKKQEKEPNFVESTLIATGKGIDFTIDYLTEVTENVIEAYTPITFLH